MAIMRTLLAVPLLLLGACAMDASGVHAGAPARVGDGDSFSMHPGESVDVAGDGTLRYVDVANDSRCKPGVQCIWAGDAEVAFEWRPASGAVDAFSLHTGRAMGMGGNAFEHQHRIGDHVLTLVELARGDAPAAMLKLGALAQ